MSDSKKFLIITSIFAPTEAVIKFAQIDGWQLVVVGDKKTPEDWNHPNVTYLSPEDQEKMGYEIVKLLPWNHYCRKLIGYLYAMEHGAELIADSDDDNIPYDNWPNTIEDSTTMHTLSGAKFVNIYQYFTEKKIWPRGYPLDRLLENPDVINKEEPSNIGVWQYLADEDPDVDAIYRLTDNSPVFFDKNEPLALAKGTVSPFNSQNTIFVKELFYLLYLPAFVTFRFTDILRGLVAQPIMWEHGYQLGFGSSTVIQKRNPHDYLRDFESEIPVYLYSEKVIDEVVRSSSSNQNSDIGDKLILAYKALYSCNIVTENEILLIEAWVKDVRSIETKI